MVQNKRAPLPFGLEDSQVFSTCLFNGRQLVKPSTHLTIVRFEYYIRIHTFLYTRASRFFFWYLYLNPSDRTSSKQRKHILSEFRLRELRLQEIERELLLLFPWFYDSKVSLSGSNNNNNNRSSFSSYLGLRLFVSANWEF